jgi:hypothetical protein
VRQRDAKEIEFAGLLCKRVSGELIDRVESAMGVLRARLAANDAELMNLVAHARAINERRRKKLDLHEALWAMTPPPQHVISGLYVSC